MGPLKGRLLALLTNL